MRGDHAGVEKRLCVLVFLKGGVIAIGVWV